ncbi:MAG TPA: type IV pilus twitching motility protein PilT [Desulfobacteria bacterium]|nr:type IV pilus twitching motility protein PilT [Desulfobacteria bacterium]
MYTIENILKMAFEKKSSDIHLAVVSPPAFRVNGELIPANSPPLTAEDTKNLAYAMMSEDIKHKFEAHGEADFSYSLPSVGRFRVNVFRQRGSVGLVIRLIPFNVPAFESLRLPPVILELAKLPKGMVLVTGPTGSGKSTTLASMIDYINNNRRAHIITLEDPIEYLHRHKKSIVNQRELGIDTQSFSAALRAVLRQDPDVILVGELRDLETISTALTAAETGHLVFSTLHTNDATQTVDRVIDVFPANQQQQIRVLLAAVLQGVIAQQLLPKADGTGRVAAIEVLVATAAIRNLIREGKTHQIYTAIQTGAKYGMQTMDKALIDLYNSGLITYEEAEQKMVDPEALKKSSFGF